LKLLVDADDGYFFGKTKLIFYIFYPPPSKKRSRATALYSIYRYPRHYRSTGIQPC